MALVFTREKNRSGGAGRGLRAEGSLALRKATSSSGAAAAAILGWEEAAEGLAAQ